MTNYKIAVPLIGPTLEDLMQQGLKASEQEADIFEYRLDYLPQITNSLMSQIMLSFPQIPKIMTIRHADEAGPDSRAGWKGDKLKRFSALEKVASYEPAFIDIELEHFHHLQINRERTKLIVSYHNFRETPSNDVLQVILEDCLCHKANIVKIATMAKDEEDADRLLDFTERNSRYASLIVMGMGEKGRKTRIYGPSKGSYLTFACIDAENAAEPGQLTISQLRECWKEI